jgi:hypothetical protein
MDDKTLTALEREVRECRADLERLQELGQDTSADASLLAEVELLLAAVRGERAGGASEDR